MGGTSTTSSNQSQTSQLNPYSAAQPALTGILGSLGGQVGNASLNPTQQGAINTIVGNSNSQPNYSAPINSGTLGLLNGGGATANDGAISGNLGVLNNGIVGSTASGANIGANSALQPQLDQIKTDVTNDTNGAFAAAGRDGSPGNAMAVARGVAAGEAPVIASQYNTDTSNALNSANTLYGAGNTTYGILNANQQNANTNFGNGVGAVSNGLTAENAAPNSTLQAMSDQFGIPVSQLTTLLGAISPVAAQFGTQTGTGTSNGSSTMSGAQQFGLIANGIGNVAGGAGKLGTALFGAA